MSGRHRRCGNEFGVSGEVALAWGLRQMNRAAVDPVSAVPVKEIQDRSNADAVQR